jgi:hypothetical protein
MIAVSALVGSASAQGGQGETAKTTTITGSSHAAPRLAGHRFIPHSIVPDPFIRTSIRTTLGGGSSVAVTLPRTFLGDEEVGGAEGSTFLANLGFAYQLAFRERMSLLLEFDMQGQLGTEKRSIIVKGITASTKSKLGWLIRVWGNERGQLSASATVTNQSATVVDILGFVEGVIDSGGLTEENTIVRSVPSTDGRAGLRFGYRVTRFVGLITSLESGYGESIEEGTAGEWFTTGGALFSLDFSAISSIPLGLSVGGFGSSLPGLPDESLKGQRGFVLGFGYVGRDDFDLGLEATYQRNPQQLSRQPLKLAAVQLNLKYYF